MDSGLFKRRKMAIRLGLGLMVVVIISDFFLYPRQYSYPSSVSEYSTQENNDKRYFLRQQIENSKTYEQMKLRVRSSQYISQENLYDKVDPKNNRISRKIPLEKEANKFWKIKEYLQQHLQTVLMVLALKTRQAK